MMSRIKTGILVQLLCKISVIVILLQKCYIATSWFIIPSYSFLYEFHSYPHNFLIICNLFTYVDHQRSHRDRSTVGRKRLSGGMVLSYPPPVCGWSAQEVSLLSARYVLGCYGTATYLIAGQLMCSNESFDF